MEQQISELDVLEVSLVASPASRKPFALFKSADSPVTAPPATPAIVATAADPISLIKGMSEEQKAELAKTLFPDATRQQEELKKANDSLLERIGAMERESKLARYAEVAKSWTGGSPSEHAERLYKYEVALGTEEVAKMIERENAIATQLAKSELFQEVGRSGTGVYTSAESEVNTKAAELLAKSTDSDKNLRGAITEILRSSPELAARFNEERNKKARV